MQIVAGLGNPGAQYQNNRHNVGFMAADAIARRHSFSPWTKKFQGLVADGHVDGERVLLIKPQGFMNTSGQAVGEALRFHKLDPESLVVIYDELDLPPAKVRIKVGGGAGGHNGIRSIDAHCGKDYRRVRIGIGHPGVKELVQRHVLGDFAKVDAEWLDPLLDAIADNIGLVLAGQDSSFMNKVSLATGGKAESAPKAKAQSHIRQARSKGPAVQVPETGPMAAMLKRLFGKD